MDMSTANSTENRTILDWPAGEAIELLMKVQQQVSSNDLLSHQKRASKLNWHDLTVAGHSAEECRQQWEKFLSQVRTVRNLSEVVNDALVWAQDPNSRTKLTGVQDFPKAPLGPFMKYKNENYQKIKERHPEMSQAELNKKLKEKFEKLSEAKKKKLEEEYQAARAEFLAKKTEFLRVHADYQPKKRKKNKAKRQTIDQGPKLPKTAFQFYCDNKLTLPDEVSSEEQKKEIRDKKEALKLKWESLSAKRKSKYIEQVLADEKRYEIELAEYVAKNPDYKVKKHNFRVSRPEMALLATVYGRPAMPLASSYYALFCLEFHQKLALTDEGIDWMQRASEAWKALSDEERAEYKLRHTEAWSKYREECEEYLAGLPEEKREAERDVLKMDGARISKKRKVSDAPMLPRIPFDYYCDQKISSDETEENRKQQQEALKEKWVSVKDKRKVPFIEQAVADLKRYKAELAVYRLKNPTYEPKKHQRMISKEEHAILGTAYGRPKMPASANHGYKLFCHDFAMTQEPLGKGWLANAAAAWQLLSEKEKTTFTKRSQAEWTNYHAACDEYMKNVPEDRQSEERRILKIDPKVTTNGAKSSKAKRKASPAAGNSAKRKKVTDNTGKGGATAARWFYLYEQEKTFQRENAGMSEKELQQLIFAKYASLPAAQKERYEAMEARSKTKNE